MKHETAVAKINVESLSTIIEAISQSTKAGENFLWLRQ